MGQSGRGAWRWQEDDLGAFNIPTFSSLRVFLFDPRPFLFLLSDK